jgi:hypothetical protein
MDFFRRKILGTVIANNLFTLLTEVITRHDELFHAIELRAGPNLRQIVQDFRRRRQAWQTATELFRSCKHLELSLFYPEAAQHSIERTKSRTDVDRKSLLGIAPRRRYAKVAGRGQILSILDPPENRTTIMLRLLTAGGCKLASEIVGCPHVDDAQVREKL